MKMGFGLILNFINSHINALVRYFYIFKNTSLPPNSEAERVKTLHPQYRLNILSLALASSSLCGFAFSFAYLDLQFSTQISSVFNIIRESNIKYHTDYSNGNRY